LKKTLALVAVAVSALSAPPSFAQNLYVGGAIGVANTDVDCSGTISCDKNPTGVKAYGGYKFNNMFAVELGYLSLGKAKASLNGADFGLPGTVGTSLKTDGVTLGVAAFLPIANQFFGVVRAGAFAAKTKGEVSNSGITQSQSESHTQAYLGLGASYAVNKQLSVDGGVDLTKIKFGGQSASVSFWSIGASYAF